MVRPVQYVELPCFALGSPGAMGRFRVVSAWDFFPVLAAALMVSLGVAWLRSFIASMGPD